MSKRGDWRLSNEYTVWRSAAPPQLQTEAADAAPAKAGGLALAPPPPPPWDESEELLARRDSLCGVLKVMPERSMFSWEKASPTYAPPPNADAVSSAAWLGPAPKPAAAAASALEAAVAAMTAAAAAMTAAAAEATAAAAAMTAAAAAVTTSPAAPSFDFMHLKLLGEAKEALKEAKEALKEEAKEAPMTAAAAAASTDAYTPDSGSEMQDY